MSKKDAARAQRQGPNSVIQGTARDIITKAMILIDEDKELESLGFEMELQVHDELLGEVPDQKDVIERVKTKVKQYMEHPFSEDLSVPLPVSLGIGDTWMDAK
jgi:DNA polymerase-1